MKLPETKNRNFKIVAVWLGMGGLGFAYVFINLAQDYPPSATQVSDGGEKEDHDETTKSGRATGCDARVTIL